MSASAATPWSVRALVQDYVAEVSGLDIGQPLPPEAVEALKDAARQYPVLIFHQQSLDPPKLMAFGEYFGDLAPHAQLKYRVPGFPACSYVTNREPDGSVDPYGYNKRAVSFHSDGSHKPIPDAFTILHGLEVPREGGPTVFANTYAAYDALSDEMKRRLDGLEALHKSHGGINGTKGPSARPAGWEEQPGSVHPVVIIHPDTGRKAIYVNPVHTVKILGLSDEDSAALLRTLYEHCARPEFEYAHKWALGDVVLWDQRSTMHRAGGGVPVDQPRVLLRTMIVTGQELHG
jgi:taurine dioxygenase